MDAAEAHTAAARRHVVSPQGGLTLLHDHSISIATPQDDGIFSQGGRVDGVGGNRPWSRSCARPGRYARRNPTSRQHTNSGVVFRCADCRRDDMYASVYRDEQAEALTTSKTLHGPSTRMHRPTPPRAATSDDARYRQVASCIRPARAGTCWPQALPRTGMRNNWQTSDGGLY